MNADPCSKHTAPASRRPGFRLRSLPAGAALLALALLSLATAASPAPRRPLVTTIRYTVIPLGNLFPRATIAVTGLNGKGEVTGICFDSSGHPHGFRTAPFSPIDPDNDDLGGLPNATDTFATGINDSGAVCGYCYTPAAGTRGFKTAPHAAITAGDDLGSLGPSVTGNAFRTVPNFMSSQGYITGFSSLDAVNGSNPSHAFKAQGPLTPSADLGTLQPDPANPGKYLGFSSGTQVNDHGQVFGNSSTAGGAIHYFLSSGAKLSPADDLGDPSNPVKILTALNNQGVLCGYRGVTGGSLPFVTAPGGKLSTTTDLPLLAGSTSYSPTALNNSGQVVGTARFSGGTQAGEHGVLWESGKAYDLDDLIAPEQRSSSRLNRPVAINDKGIIVGTSDGGFAWMLVPAVFADLGVTISHQPQPVELGDDVTFTVKITNAGPSTSNTTTVTAGLAPGLTLLSNHPSQGTASVTSGQLTWNAGALATSQSATLTLVYRVPGPGTYSQGAKVSGSVVDQTQGNNSANDSFTVQRPASADVEITLTGTPDPVAQGSELTFTLRLENHGPDAATNVKTLLTLPNTVTILRSAAGQGTWASGQLLWNAGTLNAGAVVRATMVVAPSGPGTVNASADASADQPDESKTNNHAADQVTVLAAKLPDLSGTTSRLVYGKKKKKGTKKLVWYFTGSFTVSNIGTAPSPASQVLFLLSGDRNPDTTDRQFELKRTIPPLQPLGKRKKKNNKNTKTFKLDEPLEPAVYDAQLKGKYLIAVVDPDRKLRELTRANNIVVKGPLPPAPAK